MSITLITNNNTIKMNNHGSIKSDPRRPADERHGLFGIASLLHCVKHLVCFSSAFGASASILDLVRVLAIVCLLAYARCWRCLSCFLNVVCLCCVTVCYLRLARRQNEHPRYSLAPEWVTYNS